MRVPQKIGTKGSQKWIQILINENPQLLDKEITSFYGWSFDSIDWLSPIEIDDYAEYRDQKFLEKLGLTKLHNPLNSFWPKGGPQWDALGRVSETGPYFLVEAKANIPELTSDIQATAAASLDLIKKSLIATQKYLNCNSNIDWTKKFYQYANRIAHLYYLRCLNNVEAYLVFLYFVNDKTHKSTKKSEWEAAIQSQKQLMGLSNHKLLKYIVDVFIKIEDL